MTTRTLLTATCGTALLVALASTPTGAGYDSAHASHVSISGPVQLPGKTLPAGNYVFESPTPLTTGDVVIVRNARDQRAQWMGITSPVQRSDRLARASVVLSEAPRGELPRILAWFPSDSSTGRSFIY